MKLPRIKIIERGGITIQRMLERPDPWGGEPCGREDCWICTSSHEESGKSIGKCSTEGAVYRVQCLDCKECGVVCEYIGETSRSTYERSIEHQRALRNKDQKSPLYKHMEECHPGRTPNLLMTILRLHRKALSRQIHEALLISKSKAEILLNNKSEWSKSRIPRIRMTNKGKINDEAVQELVEKEAEEKVRKIYEETLEE